MKARLALAFPTLCALLVIGAVVWQSGWIGTRPAQAGFSAYLDPVCHMEVGTGIAFRWQGEAYYFCTEGCRRRFEGSPERYLTDVCPVCRSDGAFSPVDEGRRFEATWQGKAYRFCSASHRDAFRSDPAGYFMHTMWGIPNWLYYASIALVLIVSFGIFELQAGRAHPGRGSTCSGSAGCAACLCIRARGSRCRRLPSAFLC